MNDAPIPLSYQSPAEKPLEGWGIVRWWETRRLIYNGAVLGVGLMVIVAMWVVTALFAPGAIEPPILLLFGIVAYGFCANVCYTGGWILDLLWKEPDADAAARRRLGIFKAGLVFSCLVTTIPFWITLVVAVLGHL